MPEQLEDREPPIGGRRTLGVDDLAIHEVKRADKLVLKRHAKNSRLSFEDERLNDRHDVKILQLAGDFLLAQKMELAEHRRWLVLTNLVDALFEVFADVLLLPLAGPTSGGRWE